MNNLTEKVTARKFANQVEKDLGWRKGHIKTGKNTSLRDTRVRHEVDETFELANMPEWALVKLISLGYSATARINYKEYYGQNDKVVLYWSKDQ